MHEQAHRPVRTACGGRRVYLLSLVTGANDGPLRRVVTCLERVDSIQNGTRINRLIL